jgi:serine/threonine-protein kinase RsbW
MDRIAVELRNDRTELERLRQVADRFARDHGWPEQVRDDLQLALEEAVTNVMKYAYRGANIPPGEQRIAVHLEAGDNEAGAVIEDDGTPFDPLSLPPPDFDVPLEDMPVGGLGIHLVRQVMDHVEYRRQDGRNRLILKKYLAPLPS